MTNLDRKPISQWPDFNVVWTLEREQQKHYTDGDRSEFNSRFPDGLLVTIMELEVANTCFCFASSWPAENVWKRGVVSKTSNCISFWADGNSMTPPRFGVYDEGLHIMGGNHRFAVGKAKGMKTFPVLINPDDWSAVQRVYGRKLIEIDPDVTPEFISDMDI